jgi:hypothetical protein
MSRFIESPDLFGHGAGISTCGDFTCGICGTKYNEGNDEAENYNDESILLTDFAGIQICGDCFEDVENEILYRMPDILKWYKQIIQSKKAHLEEMEKLL